MNAAGGARSPYAIAPVIELLYDIAGLAAVLALAHYLFWVFAVVIAPAMVGSVILMGVEQMIVHKDRKRAAQEGSGSPEG